MQYELTQESLEAKREQLEELEKSEREAQRLAEALGQGRSSRTLSASTAGPDGAERTEQTEEEPAQHPPQQSVYVPPHPGPSPVRRRAPGAGLLNALTYTIHNMMDADPETARRNNISKTRETISQVQFYSMRTFTTSHLCMQFDSWKMRFICQRRILSTRVRLFKLISTDSSDKRLQISEKWPSVWQGATEIGASRYGY